MEVELTRISEKGQIVIPSSLRKTMGIKKSDKFLVFGEQDTIILKKVEKPVFKKTFDEIAAPLRRAAKESGLTRKDLELAIKDVRANAKTGFGH
jgi:AbrB family looped-hinge helix DNA binding protein